MYIQTNESEHLEYGHGTIFGSTERFLEVANELFCKETASPTSRNITIPPFRGTASVTMCTLLKLSLKDYLYEIAPSQPLVDEEDEDEEVNSNSTFSAKADEIVCRRFERQSEKALSRCLYDFLVKYEILPKNSHSASFQYMQHGNVGRSIILNREDNLVYILIEGSMKMQLIKPTKSMCNQSEMGDTNSSYYEISCRRAGQLPLNVKVFIYLVT